MTGPLATAAIVVPLVVAGWALVLLIAGRPPGRALLVGLGVAEVALVVFGVWAIVQVVGTSADVARLEILLYVAGLVAVVPGAAWWVRGERSRAAAGVLMVALIVASIMVVRVQQVWAGV